MDLNRYVLSLSCPDRPGIVHAVTGAIAAVGGNITESQQFGAPDTGKFFMRVEFEADSSPDDLRTAVSPVADRFSMTWNLDIADRPMRTIVMVSKADHCLGDLLYRERAGTLPIEIVAVVGNHATLREIAEFYGKSFVHIPVTAESKDDAETALLAMVEELDVELVVLARYMQILSPALAERLRGKAINIHHSFLPSFKGARPYFQAHDRGVKIIGATAHYVTSDLDEGPIIEQDVERVEHAHNPEALTSIGADVERKALARAVRWHAQHRVLLDGHRTIVFK